MSIYFNIILVVEAISISENTAVPILRVNYCGFEGAEGRIQDALSRSGLRVEWKMTGAVGRAEERRVSPQAATMWFGKRGSKKRKMRGFHGSEHVYDGLLGCYIEWICGWLPTFQRNIPPLSSVTWRIKESKFNSPGFSNAVVPQKTRQMKESKIKDLYCSGCQMFNYQVRVAIWPQSCPPQGIKKPS